MTDRARITRKYGDIVELARSREQDPGKTHWEGCESAHYECLIQCMADEIERLRAEVLEQCRLNGMGGSREAKLRAEIEQQRLELSITEDACGMLESEVKQLRAEVLDMREEIAGYRGLQADQANARCELLEMLKLERARVAELEAALDHYSGGASEALLRAPAMKNPAP